MKVRRLLIRVATGLSLAWAVAPIHAGEISCGFGGCDLNRTFLELEWKPASRCRKPPAPFMLFGSNVREYNASVDSFNRWLAEVKIYVQCVNTDAAADAQKVPTLIEEAAKKLQNEMVEEVRRTRSNLEMMKP